MGTMARMVATNAALSIRIDALFGVDSKSSVDAAPLGVFFVNLFYRAKIKIHVTRTKRCLGLRTRQKCSCYCPKSCWDSGSWPLSLGWVMGIQRFRTSTQGRVQNANLAYYPLSVPLLYSWGWSEAVVEE